MKISCLRLCIRTLGISLMLMGAAVAQGQVFNPALQNASQIQRKIATDRQIHLLTRQINQVQLQSVNLSMEIADLTGQPPGAAAAVKNSNVVNPAPSPALIAAQQSAAVAQRAAEDLKQKTLGPVHLTQAYVQAAATLAADRAQLDQARGQADGPTPAVVTLANRVLADEALISRFERQALDQSAEWKAASAKSDQANRAVAVQQQDQRQQALGNAAPAAALPPNVAAQVRAITAQRDSLDAKGRGLLDQLSRLSPRDAELVSQEGQGMLEETEEMHHQQQGGLKTAAGAPLIHFSQNVTPQVQHFLQGNLDEMQRMKDPAYAAAKAQAQQQQQDEQQRQVQAQFQQDQDDARQAYQQAEKQAEQDRAAYDQQRQQADAAEQQRERDEAAQKQQEEDAERNAKQQQELARENDERMRQDAEAHKQEEQIFNSH
jgi:hypothetical protein